MPVTEHQLKVLEWFKGAELIGNRAELRVAQDSEQFAHSPHAVAHTGGGKVFKVSEEYVLFLERLPGQSALGVAWGSGGAYKLDGDSAKLPDLARKMWQFRDEVAREELLNALRSKRGQNHGQ